MNVNKPATNNVLELQMGLFKRLNRRISFIVALCVVSLAQADNFVGKNPSYRDTTIYWGKQYTIRFALSDSTRCADSTHFCYARYYGVPYGDMNSGILGHVFGKPGDTISFSLTIDSVHVPRNDQFARLEVLRYDLGSQGLVDTWDFKVADVAPVRLANDDRRKVRVGFNSHLTSGWFRLDGKILSEPEKR